MKCKFLFLSLILMAFYSSNAQDIFFNHFENTPLHTNSALTGVFEGNARMSTAYKNVQSTALKRAAVNSGFISVDSKFDLNEHRFIGYGISSYLDLAGESSFGTKNLKVHTSFIQVFGDTKEAHHRISIGISAGIARNKYLAWISDLHNSMQIINTEDYLDLGTGLAWIYKSNTKFTCQIGVSADHLNRPTVSEILGTSNQLERKYTIHGSSEIPLIKRFTVLPGFLFSSQGMIDRGAIGLDSKWYFNPGNAYHSFRSLQMGVYLMEEVDDLDQLKSESIVLRSSIETRSLILGFAYNQVVSGLRNSNFANSAIECTVAYTFGKKEIGEKSIIKDK